MKGIFKPGPILGVMFLSIVMVLTGCPTQSAIQKAANGADRLPGLTDSVITAVGQAYQGGVITLAQKDALGKKLQLVIDGGREFDKAVKTAQVAKDSSTGTLAALNALFSDKVAAPFLQIVEDLKLVSPAKAAAVLTALALVRTVIVEISVLFTQAGYTSPATKEVLNARYA